MPLSEVDFVSSGYNVRAHQSSAIAPRYHNYYCEKPVITNQRIDKTNSLYCRRPSYAGKQKILCRVTDFLIPKYLKQSRSGAYDFLNNGIRYFNIESWPTGTNPQLGFDRSNVHEDTYLRELSHMYVATFFEQKPTASSERSTLEEPRVPDEVDDLNAGKSGNFYPPIDPSYDHIALRKDIVFFNRGSNNTKPFNIRWVYDDFVYAKDTAGKKFRILYMMSNYTDSNFDETPGPRESYCACFQVDNGNYGGPLKVLRADRLEFEDK